MKFKFQHVFFSFLICITGTSFHPKWGVVLALSFGVLKETIDCLQRSRLWSWGDIGADLLGIAVATIAYGMVEKSDILQTVTGLVARFLP